MICRSALGNQLRPRPESRSHETYHDPALHLPAVRPLMAAPQVTDPHLVPEVQESVLEQAEAHPCSIRQNGIGFGLRAAMWKDTYARGMFRDTDTKR